MMPAAQAFRLFFPFAAILALAACSPRIDEGVVEETEDPIFRRAKEMLDRGLAGEALTNFSKLIIKRGGDAPESHLEAGLIYLNHVKDPISAYYHFNRYKAIMVREPETDERDAAIERVNDLLKSARKDLLAEFPSDVYKDPLERIKLIDTIEALRKENNGLKDALTAARTKLRRYASSEPSEPAVEEGAADAAGEATEVSPRSPIAGRAAVEAPREEGTRVYTVREGDSLYSISRRFYGDPTRWPEILEANQERLPSASRLRAGMRLRIP